MTSSAAKQQGQQPVIDPFDPRLSVWVSASAGSGKTTLLTRRVLRLLLEMPTPNVLCLTYTRAAAAQMQTIIHARLAKWAVMDEADLRDEIAQQFGFSADQPRIRHAQRLFTHILDAPDQLRIMTVHGFCQYILNSFPVEAGLLPHFSLLEGDAVTRFQDEAMQAFLGILRADPELQQAFDVLGQSSASSRLRKLLEQIFYNRAAWERFWRAMPDRAAYRKKLEEECGCGAGESEDSILDGFIAATPEAAMQVVCQLLEAGSKTARERSGLMRGWLENRADRRKNFYAYASAFLTQKHAVDKKLVPADLRKNHPDYAEALEREAMRVAAVFQRLAQLRFMARQTAFYHVMRRLDGLAEEIKRRHAVLTYDDLIIRTRMLLENPRLSGWILYKLDRAIDHLLVDEAQDTSPDQWQVVMRLLDEFLSGEGARSDVSRTLFVVGDEKQSIYSFQGADRETYLKIRDTLFARMKAVKRPMVNLDRHASFRTLTPILDYVDAVFAPEDARRGVSEHPVAHSSARTQTPGFVELWPPVLDQTPPDPVPWAPPLAREEYQPAEVQLAERIARTIRAWLDEGLFLTSQNRPLAPDDVMILLQKRGRLLFPIVRALKDANIPVAGVDRMVLAEQAAVQDVLSFFRFLLLPQDDLALAEVLRGPFIRMDDAQLLVLAHARTGTLWDVLQADPACAALADYLRGFLNLTDYITPFVLLNRLLFTPCPADRLSGQHALTLRLGADAIDPLEELLAMALDFENEQTPSLQLFTQSLGRNAQESKRELSKVKGQVRILTVHGAKGLEAPIVFVPDLARDPHKNAEAPSVYYGTQGFPFCVGDQDDLVPQMAAAKAAARNAREEEHRRLLYVALTRAHDGMILCGISREDARGKAPWHDLCRTAMERLQAGSYENAEGGQVWLYGDKAALLAPKTPVETAGAVSQPLPAWLRNEAAQEKDRAVINPSQIGMLAEKIQPPRDDRAGAGGLHRGTLMHTLLQMLPDIPAERREETASSWLSRQPDMDAAQVPVDVAEIMRVIADPVFAPVFSAASQAEVPVAGVLSGRLFSGQIDRLVVGENDVLIVDYKTNRPPPKNVAEVPEAYLAQMAAYRALMGLVYPRRNIRCALLWTHIPALMELDEAALTRGAAILKKAA